MPSSDPDDNQTVLDIGVRNLMFRDPERRKTPPRHGLGPRYPPEGLRGISATIAPITTRGSSITLTTLCRCACVIVQGRNTPSGCGNSRHCRCSGVECDLYRTGDLGLGDGPYRQPNALRCHRDKIREACSPFTPRAVPQGILGLRSRSARQTYLSNESRIRTHRAGNAWLLTRRWIMSSYGQPMAQPPPPRNRNRAKD